MIPPVRPYKIQTSAPKLQTNIMVCCWLSSKNMHFKQMFIIFLLILVKFPPKWAIFCRNWKNWFFCPSEPADGGGHPSADGGGHPSEYLRGGINWILDVHILMNENQSENKSPFKIDGLAPFWLFSPQAISRTNSSSPGSSRYRASTVLRSVIYSCY